MRDSITISGKTYELATNAYTPIAYKEQFGKDYFQDLFSMVSTQSILDKIEHLNEEEKLETGDIDLSILTNFDMTFFHRIFWVFAKSANPKIKPFKEFFMEMEEFPVQEVATILMNMLNQGMNTRKKQIKQKQQVKKSLRQKAIYFCCKETGLSIDDLKHVSIGMALDYQTDYVNLRTNETSNTRKANQSDFDNF